MAQPYTVLVLSDSHGNVEAMAREKKQGAKIRTHYSSAQFYDNRHPRAAFGTDDEGNAYLVVIDGRFPGQADGATIYETAYICHLLGMTDAINLDGGGSSCMLVNGKETIAVSDGSQRAVASAIMLK